MSCAGPEIKQEDLASALRATNGLIYRAARDLGCSAKTIYNRVDADPFLREIVEESRGQHVDAAENSLRKAVEDGEAWAVCFTLKCLAKNRGYVERIEHTGKDGEALEGKQSITIAVMALVKELRQLGHEFDESAAAKLLADQHPDVIEGELVTQNEPQERISR